jgi:glutamate racemase
MIGVYDSGYGGLTVLAALRVALPGHCFVFLGDNGRAPYGDRDSQTILDFSEQCVEHLFDEGCSLVVVACHTVSCIALRHLQRRYGSDRRRILGVTIPAAEMAVTQVAATKGRDVGWIGTTRTVTSRTPETEIAKLDPSLRVHLLAAPLLAPIVEEGLQDSPIAELTVAHYLRNLPQVDALVLGCTHYPLLLPIFQRLAPSTTAVLDPAAFVAARLVDWLHRHPGFSAPQADGRGWLRLLATGDPRLVGPRAARFYATPLPPVEHIAESAGHLTHRTSPEQSLGQVLR